MCHFSEQGARRVRRMVEGLERRYRNPPARKPSGPVGSGVMGVLARTGPGGIPAAPSPTQMGVGEVAILRLGSDGTVTATEGTALCFNGFGEAIAPYANILMYPGSGGYTCLLEYGSGLC